MFGGFGETLLPFFLTSPLHVPHTQSNVGNKEWLLAECFHHTLELSVEVIHWAQILALAIGQARRL